MAKKEKPMKVYLLYYDTNSGASEEWNLFYTPCEVLLSPKKRQERIDYIKTNTSFDGDFHEEDKEVKDADITAEVGDLE